MTIFITIDQRQRDKETGEPYDATSIKYGSAGGWEKRPHSGPRSQPTQPWLPGWDSEDILEVSRLT